jgi:outer membrane receptor protein involved in Fe transport
MKKIVVALIVFSITFPLYSQDAPDSANLYVLSLEDLMNIPITTASKFEQSIKEAPSTISLITRDQILKYGWLSGNEVLNRLPGFSMSQDYDRPTVSSRGIYEGWNNNHLLMLIDGVSFNDNMYGTAFTWEVTPLVFAKSIEVIRGPGSALYGSSATNGVISINSLSAEDLNNGAEVRFRIGNNKTRIFDVAVGGSGEKISFVSSFNFYSTDGTDYKSLDASGGVTEFNIQNNRSSFYLFNKIEGAGTLKGFSLQHHEQSWNFSTGHGWLFLKPDKPENMKEGRRLLVLKYKTPDIEKKFTQEYAVRYQRHEVDWNARMAPDNTVNLLGYGIDYPYGLTEQLKTSTSDIFSRAQFSYDLGNKSIILGGIENSILFYGGDKLHTSNADLSNTFNPTPNNEFVNVGDYFAWLGDNPFINTGIFAQYTSPKFAEVVQVTFGLRYDNSSFKFNTLDVDPNKEESKSFDKLNPRLSIVFTPSQKFSLKLMGGQAFRTPAVSELFGRNTYLLGSNIRELKPETITTFELSSDLAIGNNLNWRFNAYYTEFNDQIAYSSANLSTNLFSLTNFGMENELTFQTGKLDGFLNHSFVQRTDEKIVDSNIGISKNEITWVPQQILNIGAKYNERKFYISAQGHYQGPVNRRSSDLDPSVDNIRGTKVDGWFTVDMRCAFKPLASFEVGIIGSNLLDKDGKLLKNGAVPFDYQMPGRSVLLDIRFMF